MPVGCIPILRQHDRISVPPGQNSDTQRWIGSILDQRGAGSFVSTSKLLRRDHEKGPRKGALRNSSRVRSTVEQPFPDIPHDHNS